MQYQFRLLKFFLLLEESFHFVYNSCYVYGLRGPGVYSGTTPTPSWALKHIPYSGWGLGNAPVRIPIKINPNMPVEYVNWPFKTAIFRTGSEPLKLVP